MARSPSLKEHTPLAHSPADLRAIIARDGRKLYQIAAAADVHPSYLGSMLAGRIALTAAVATRVLHVVRPG